MIGITGMGTIHELRFKIGNTEYKITSDSPQGIINKLKTDKIIRGYLLHDSLSDYVRSTFASAWLALNYLKIARVI